MKKKFSKLPLILLVAFTLFNQFQMDAQRKVRGNGNVTTVEHEVDPFTVLDLDGVFNVFIQQGSKEKVTVETDDNLHEYIEIDNRGKKLVINTRTKTNFRKKKRMNIYVTIVDLERLKISGVGNVETENTLELKDLELRIKNVGNVDLALEANYLEVDMNSVGNVTLAGKIKEADIKNGGVGKLAAYKLESETLKLKASGVGKTEVYASKELAIKSTGVGNVYYKGDAVITDLNIRGVGKVKKRD